MRENRKRQILWRYKRKNCWWIHHDFFIFFDEIMKLINVFIIFDFHSEFVQCFSKLFSVNRSFEWIFWLINLSCSNFSNELWFFRSRFSDCDRLHNLEKFVFYQIFSKFMPSAIKIKNGENVFYWQRQIVWFEFFKNQSNKWFLIKILWFLADETRIKFKIKKWYQIQNRTLMLSL